MDPVTAVCILAAEVVVVVAEYIIEAWQGCGGDGVFCMLLPFFVR